MTILHFFSRRKSSKTFTELKKLLTFWFVYGMEMTGFIGRGEYCEMSGQYKYIVELERVCLADNDGDNPSNT